MRTGLKTLFHKLKKAYLYPESLYPPVSENRFPNGPLSKLSINARLFGLTNILATSKRTYNLGSLYTIPNNFVSRAYKLMIGFNTNHLGTWTVRPESDGTERLEYEVIRKMSDLYKIPQKTVEGYITSGGTEGNMFSLWLARQTLKKKYGKKKICLITTGLSHYSIKKAAEIADAPRFEVPLNNKEWNMDIRGLSETIDKLQKRGFDGFILALTIGYTTTGTADDLKAINKIIEAYSAKFPGIKILCWIDSSLNGLIEPFISNSFKPFDYRSVISIVTDFHKFGLTPYSSGVVLYRASLKKIIDKKIDYLKQTDSTLLGSRPGASAVAVWTAIHVFGKKGYKKIVDAQLNNKKYFLQKLTAIDPNATIVNRPESLTVSVVFSAPHGNRLPLPLEDKYWLAPTTIKLFFYPQRNINAIMYKFFFLPHVKKRILEKFFSDLSKTYKQHSRK